MFGLHRSAGLAAPTRVTAGHAFALDSPVRQDGVTLFRRSFWLPLPALLGTSDATRLDGSALAVRFASTDLAVDTDDAAWFDACTDDGADETRFTMAWPAPIRRFVRRSGSAQRAIALLRADGDAVADEAAQSGTTGANLDPPWVGASFVVRLGATVAVLQVEQIEHVGVARLRSRAAPGAPSGAAAASAPVAIQAQAIARLGLHSQNLASVVVAGQPTSPRLRLFAEQAGGTQMLLWQALAAGPQAVSTLPAGHIADEWQPAFDQLHRLQAEAAAGRQPALQRLRLDVESDTPCAVQVTQLDLRLAAEIELLGEPRKLVFDGLRRQRHELPLDLPAGAMPVSLALAGRVVADAGSDAAAAAAPADGRLGALLDAGQAALQPVDLGGTLALAGVSLFWQPLSDRLVATLRVHAGGADGPGGKRLAQAEVALDTPSGGWLALRFAPIDLQAQRLWLEWSIAEGRGLWLFAATGAPGARLEPGGGAAHRALPQPLTTVLLPAAPEVDAAAPRAIALEAGGETIVAALPPDALAVSIGTPALAKLALQPIAFTGGTRGSVTVESARLRVSEGG